MLENKNVVDLVEFEADPIVVEILEGLLKDAKDGKIVELVGSYIHADNLIGSFNAGDAGNRYSMYGALASSAEFYREKHIES